MGKSSHLGVKFIIFLLPFICFLLGGCISLCNWCSYIGVVTFVSHDFARKPWGGCWLARRLHKCGGAGGRCSPPAPVTVWVPGSFWISLLLKLFIINPLSAKKRASICSLLWLSVLEHTTLAVGKESGGILPTTEPYLTWMSGDQS